MPALTQDEINELNPDKVYNLETFVLHYELWPSIDPNLNVVLGSPIKIKFDENIRTNLGSLRTKKGIYIFLVEPQFPINLEVNYLVYIGRVIKTNTFSNRFTKYINAIGNKNIKRNVQLLTNLWPSKTWVYFYALNLSDTKIINIERMLVDNIIPPLNNSFTLKKAQNSRSIYN